MTTHTLTDKLPKVVSTMDIQHQKLAKLLEERPKLDGHVCEGDHTQRMLAMRDAMDVLGGKWRLQLIGILSFKGKMRFTDFLKNVDGIGAKMLSKELQDLEANQLVTRTVKQTKPITVEYEITDYGFTLNQVICEIVSWGLAHREKIMKG